MHISQLLTIYFKLYDRLGDFLYRTPANFTSNVPDLHFQGQRFDRLHWEVHTWLSRKWWQIGKILLLPTHAELHVAFPLAWFLPWSWPILKVKVKIMQISTVNILQTVIIRTNIATVNTESRMWPFDWHIYIWSWPILKVKIN